MKQQLARSFSLWVATHNFVSMRSSVQATTTYCTVQGNAYENITVRRRQRQYCQLNMTGFQTFVQSSEQIFRAGQSDKLGVQNQSTSTVFHALPMMVKCHRHIRTCYMPKTCDIDQRTSYSFKVVLFIHTWLSVNSAMHDINSTTSKKYAMSSILLWRVQCILTSTRSFFIEMNIWYLQSLRPTSFSVQHWGLHKI